MHYELTENEFYRLESCVRQIDLITDLCSHIPAGHQAIATDGLQSFLCAQQEVLYATLKALDERQKAQQVLNQNAPAATPIQPAAPAISPDLLVRIIETCSGVDVGSEALLQIRDELSEAINFGYPYAFNAFFQALSRLGYEVETVFRGADVKTTIKRATSKDKAKPKAPARKRERLTATA